MFTGIVRDVGTVRALEPRGGDLRLWIDVRALPMAGVLEGDSICVSGCCLTALEVAPRGFAADVSRETLALTTLGALEAKGFKVIKRYEEDLRPFLPSFAQP